MANIRCIIILAFATVAFVSPFAALPADANALRDDVMLVAQNDGPSLSEAVAQVRRQYNGRIVSAETRMRGNREMHYIKVLTSDGKVITKRIPGRTRGERG